MAIDRRAFWSLLAFLLLARFAVGADNDRTEDAIRAMVEAEKQFYQTGQEQGTRAAFLLFLADDAVVFRPGPVNGKKAWTERAETGLSLVWQPTFAAMARSADFGYTTGPAEWKAKKEDEKPLGYGQFVSVWKKQKDGTWKVALDVGTENPRPVNSPDGLQMLSTDDGLNAPVDLTLAHKALREAQKKFAEAARSDSTTALLSVATNEIRAYREGVFPSVGKDATALMLSVKRGKMSLEQIAGDMSRSGDMAYSYGKYTTLAQDNEQGYYLQIWQTDAKGAWKVVIDLQKNLLHPEKKPAS
ncbi:MAG: nuclear transport factor 2 family protein [Verrucomicrobiota bacterium]